MSSVLRPRIAISACLLGDRVRYDGGHKAHAVARDVLAPHVEWIPVCPEVEAGLGVPRPAIEVVADDPVRVARVEGGADVQTPLLVAARHRIRALAEWGVDGHVVKARSPSCGLGDTPRPGAGGVGPGLYVSRLLVDLPDLPIEDESGLDDADRLRRFLDAVVARAIRRTSSQADVGPWLSRVLG